MLGITGDWFAVAKKGLDLDPRYSAESALAQSYLIDTARWISKSTLDGSGGAQPSSGGVFYGVKFGVCTPGTHANGCQCGSNNGSCATIDASRQIAGEALGDLALGVLASGNDPTLQTPATALFAACYAKYAGNPGYDGHYCSEIDPVGGFQYGTVNAKYFGFQAGIGRNASFMSAIQGGLLAADNITVQVQGKISSIPNAAKMQVIATSPAGVASTPVVCSSSPCAVTINRTVGNWGITVAYLSSSNAVLAKGSSFVISN
jgi:hypothetical protein